MSWYVKSVVKKFFTLIIFCLIASVVIVPMISFIVGLVGLVGILFVFGLLIMLVKYIIGGSFD
jgi:hypothetical protein